MPSNKILFMLIICFGIVVSVYLFSRNPDNSKFLTQGIDGVSTNPYINVDENTNNDWKKILISMDSSKNATTILTNNDPSVFDDTTLTGQMSRDLLSQYLSAVRGGEFTKEESIKIAENTLSIPGYTKTGGAKYIASNLHVTAETDRDSMQAYEDKINLILQNRSSKVKENPLAIFQDAITRANETKLAKLDPIILQNKGLLNDLLLVEVPKSAVGVHLALLNAFSNILSDLEAIRVVFTDPVRSLVAVNQYQLDESSLKIALNNINSFFTKN